jgi:alkyl hydroperoxide reductase subunit AhpC
MLDAVEKDALGVPMTVRKVFIIDPAKLIRLTITYPPGYVEGAVSWRRPDPLSL